MGRLSYEKRIEWLHDVLQAIPDAWLGIVGDGPARPALAQLFATTQVVFTGYLHGEDLAQAYAAADVFVFPSANETFGNVVLEAMAAGQPVVAPHSGGLVDFVRDGETGLLVDSNDRKAFIDAIRRLLTNRAYLRQRGKVGRVYAMTWNWERAIDQLLSAYVAVSGIRQEQDTPFGFHSDTASSLGPYLS